MKPFGPLIAINLNFKTWKIDLQHQTIILKSTKNTLLRDNLFIIQKNAFFNNKLINNEKMPKIFIKLKSQSKVMQKGENKQKAFCITRNSQDKLMLE